MKIGALIFGILGGLAGLAIAGWASFAVGLLGLAGLAQGTQTLVNVLLWALPISTLVGAGLATNSPALGGGLMLASATGWFVVGVAALGSGINFVTGGTVILSGLGGIFALVTAGEEASAGNGWRLALAWLFVGIPLSWGVVQTCINALQLFK